MWLTHNSQGTGKVTIQSKDGREPFISYVLYVPTIYEKQTHKSWIVAWERLYDEDGSANNKGV